MPGHLLIILPFFSAIKVQKKKKGIFTAMMFKLLTQALVPPFANGGKNEGWWVGEGDMTKAMFFYFFFFSYLPLKKKN